VDETATRRRDELENLFRTDGAKLWRALYAFAGDAETASEARAEAFAQALSHRGDLRSPAAWVWTSAFRIARGMMQHPSGAIQIVEPSYEAPEPVRDLVQALARLPVQQRMAVVLHDYADRPANEVATSMGLARATVYVHLSVGRKRLRTLLEEHTDA
jgi:RNA polymerase sigma-70 factor (ECF subfamily)